LTCGYEIVKKLCTWVIVGFSLQIIHIVEM